MTQGLEGVAVALWPWSAVVLIGIAAVALLALGSLGLMALIAYGQPDD